MIVVNVATSSESSVACSDPGPHRHGVAELLRMRRRAPRARRRLRGGLHRVELALLVEERLRGRDVEDGERRAAERAQIAVPGDPDDLVLPGGAERRDADPVADGELLLVRDPLVDRDLLARPTANAPRRG